MTTLPSPLIRAEELLARLGTVCVLDARFDLARPDAGAEAFLAGHIPGAQYVHLDHDLSAKGDVPALCGGRHPLPTREYFAATVARWGITPTTPVVVADAQGGMFAARVWWMLRWLGHDAVAVLDGGWAKWVAEGRPVTTDAPPAGAETFTPRASGLRTVAVDAVAASLASRSLLLIDARAPERFRGETEPLDPVAGHIPGATNRPYAQNLNPDGTFRPAVALRAEFATLVGDRPLDTVVHQCGSGVTACHNQLAMEIAGLAGTRLYPGSWSEWVADPARPVAAGG
jgi:thiosulfate/3-mercaptopyruvate sulfurtransferase